jgi:hypothetical protein
MHTAGLEAGIHATKTQNDGVVQDVPFRLPHNVTDFVSPFVRRIVQGGMLYCSINVVILG